jgi:hypothetical protein
MGYDNHFIILSLFCKILTKFLFVIIFLAYR